MYTRKYTGKINLVILDLAGTVCDGPHDLRHRWPEDDLRGCKAPVLPFYAVLKKHGVIVDWGTIRHLMGMYKPEHLRLLLNHPDVEAQYMRLYGHRCTPEEYEALLDEFKSELLLYALDDDLIKPVSGAAACIEQLREADIFVGYDTGYFDNVARSVTARLAKEFDIVFDVCTNSEIVRGRPSPCMIFDCMSKSHIWPADSVVKVDDTAAGILSGNNAGCWTVGVYATGSNSYEQLAAARPDFLIPSIQYLPETIFCQIEPLLRRGERAGQNHVK